MPNIGPVSDLRNNFAEISRIIHENDEPVFLTKNGFGSIVVMSIEQYERQQFDSEILSKQSWKRKPLACGTHIQRLWIC